MTREEVSKMVESIGYPAAYHHFEEGRAPALPYLVYLYSETNNFYADGVVYQSISQLNIELYTDDKDPEAEKQVEAVLKEHGFFYRKSESYIETEKMYKALYETEVLING